jgi:hypothetical protein
MVLLYSIVNNKLIIVTLLVFQDMVALISGLSIST